MFGQPLIRGSAPPHVVAPATDPVHCQAVERSEDLQYVVIGPAERNVGAPGGFEENLAFLVLRKNPRCMGARPIGIDLGKPGKPLAINSADSQRWILSRVKVGFQPRVPLASLRSPFETAPAPRSLSRCRRTQSAWRTTACMALPWRVVRKGGGVHVGAAVA